MLKQKFQRLLETMIVNQTGLSKSTSNFFSCTVESVLSYESVTHKKLAQPLSNSSSLESSIRRVERFFADSCINHGVFFYMIWRSLNIKNKVTLVMDRTTWCYGKKPINLLVVSVIWNNASIPIVWETLAKKGGSKTEERKRILRKVTSVIGIENIEVLLADREFIGYEWFKFLHSQGIPFIIRIKEGSHVTYDFGGRTNAKTIMKIVTPKGRRESNVSIFGVPVRLFGTRSVNNELIIVAASRTILGDILDAYRMRWLI